MKIVPRALVQNPRKGVRVLAADVDAGLAILHKSLDVPLVHDEVFAQAHSLSVILRGEKRIADPDGVSLTVGENGFVFLPRDLYMISDLLPAEGHSFDSYIFFFSDALLDEFCAARDVSRRRSAEAVPDDLAVHRGTWGRTLTSFAQNLRAVFAGVQDAKIRRNLLKHKLLELLMLVEAAEATDDFVHRLLCLANRGQRRERDLRSFMERYYDKPLSVEDYADLTGRSPSTFLRDFKRQFQSTPRRWLTDRRIEKARELLKDGRTSVTEAAYEIGYENISHFIREFKKRYDVSPKQYALLQERRI